MREVMRIVLALALGLAAVDGACSVGTTCPGLPIGGIFNPWNSSRSLNRQGQEHLAAFLMAVKEINDVNKNPDLLKGYQLKVNIAYNAFDFLTSVQEASKLDAAKPTPLAVISSLPDKTAVPATHVLESVDVVHIVTQAPTAELSKGIDYPYKIRLCQCDSFFGYVLQRVLSTQFKYKRVAIFATVDYFSTQSLHAFLSFDENINNSTGPPNFEVLYSTILEPDSPTYAEHILEAKATGALVFVLLTDPNTTAVLLVEGKELGLFPLGSSIFGHTFSLSSTTIAAVHALDPSRDPDYYFTGFMGFRPAPDYSVSVTDVGKRFAENFAKQSPTKSSGVCSQDRDDSSAQKKYFDVSGYPCAGLNFSEYRGSSGREFDEYTGNVYDAVWALARALDVVINDQHAKNITSMNRKDRAEKLMDAFITSVSFMGVTNLVSFNEGLKVNGRVTSLKMGYGDRDSGYTYVPVNYNAAADNVQNWAPVGHWDVEGDWQLCDEYLMESLHGPLQNCSHTVIYNTADGKRPSDRPVPILNVMPVGLSGLFFAFGALSILTTVAIGGYLVFHRNSNLVKASQPPMMAMVLAGQLLVGIRIVISGSVLRDDLNVWKCSANVWLAHLGPIMIYFGLFLKMWRLDKLLHTKGLKRIKISNKDIALIGLVMVVLVVIYLAIMTTVSKPFVAVTMTTLANKDQYFYECDEGIPAMEDALFGVEAFFILWGIRLVFATKDAPSAVNESLFIAAATGIIIVLFGIGLSITQLLAFSPVVVEIIEGFAMSLGSFSTLAVLFYPKVSMLWAGEDTDKRLKVSKIQKDERANEEGVNTKHAREALKGLSLDDQYGHCQREISFWQQMLIAIDQKRSSDTGSGSGSATSFATTMSAKPTSEVTAKARYHLTSSIAVAAEDDEKDDNDVGDTETQTQ